MPPPSPPCLTFTFACNPITLQVICLGNLPIHLAFSTERHERAKEWLKKQLGTADIIESTDRHCFADLLGEYFTGRLRKFPAQVGSPFVKKGTDFQKRVWEQIAKIPYGETRTYGELAKAMGKPGAARAVGQACNANPLPLIVPCHRVTGSTGLGGFAGGDTAKKFLLALEERTLLKGEGAIVVEV